MRSLRGYSVCSDRMLNAFTFDDVDILFETNQRRAEMNRKVIHSSHSTITFAKTNKLHSVAYVGATRASVGPLPRKTKLYRRFEELS